MAQKFSNEIISAEIVFSRNNDFKKLPAVREEYQQELSVIDNKLKKYINNADRYDYMVAVASGILCGVLNSQIADISKRFFAANKNTIQNKGKEWLKSAARRAENEGNKTSSSALFYSILAECLKQKADNIITKNAENGDFELNTSRFVLLFGSVALKALLKWLAKERKAQEIDESDLPDTIKRLLRQLQVIPKVREFLKNPKMPNFSSKKLEQMGVPVVLITMFESQIKDANSTLKNYKKIVNNQLHDFIEKFPKIRLNENIMNQAVSVLANELIVRGFYFIRHLLEEFNRCGSIEAVNWDKIIPFDNRTIVRMMSVASLTFTAADMSSALVRARIESGANQAVFLTKYVSNINIVGVGRAIIAVYKDVSMEWEEANLIRERRLLAEKISAEQIDAILSFRKQMEKVVETYLAEDLKAFLTGAEEIEAGLEANDSNLVIHGNVTIQRILGRKPQFTNQDEFDNLMDAEEAFVL